MVIKDFPLAFLSDATRFLISGPCKRDYQNEIVIKQFITVPRDFQTQPLVGSKASFVLVPVASAPVRGQAEVPVNVPVCNESDAAHHIVIFPQSLVVEVGFSKW